MQFNYCPELYKILKQPHLLIAGTTGSGKSTLIHKLIFNFLAFGDGDLILIDPKRIELRQYTKLTQTKIYAQTPQEALSALFTAIKIMEDRFIYLEQTNQTQYTGKPIYIIIDELADLMLSDEAKQIKKALQKLLQLARATNIHIIAATQVPNRKVIPAELVLNFTDRIALRCLSAIESRQIINQNGAELLPRVGEFLYLSANGIEKYAFSPNTQNELAERINFWTYKPPIKLSIIDKFKNLSRPILQLLKFKKVLIIRR